MSVVFNIISIQSQQQIRTHATTVSDNSKSSRLEELRNKLKTEEGNLEEFVSTGFEKMTHTEALALRETVVPGTKVKTTKL